jgi:hypothetical protein
VKGTP